MRDAAPVSHDFDFLAQDIARARRDFPGSRLSFRLELRNVALTELARLCNALAGTGLTLVDLRARGTGVVHCLLLDDGQADLPGLLDALGPQVTLDRWTTQIGF